MASRHLFHKCAYKNCGMEFAEMQDLIVHIQVVHLTPGGSQGPHSAAAAYAAAGRSKVPLGLSRQFGHYDQYPSTPIRRSNLRAPTPAAAGCSYDYRPLFPEADYRPRQLPEYHRPMRRFGDRRQQYEMNIRYRQMHYAPQIYPGRSDETVQAAHDYYGVPNKPIQPVCSLIDLTLDGDDDAGPKPASPPATELPGPSDAFDGARAPPPSPEPMFARSALNPKPQSLAVVLPLALPQSLTESEPLLEPMQEPILLPLPPLPPLAEPKLLQEPLLLGLPPLPKLDLKMLLAQSKPLPEPLQEPLPLPLPPLRPLARRMPLAQPEPEPLQEPLLLDLPPLTPLVRPIPLEQPGPLQLQESLEEPQQEPLALVRPQPEPQPEQQPEPQPQEGSLAYTISHYACPLSGCTKMYRDYNGMKYHMLNYHNVDAKYLSRLLYSLPLCITTEIVP